jgi:malic enzyme
VRDPSTAALYTSRGNLVAVISNGTAVLGWATSARWPASR